MFSTANTRFQIWKRSTMRVTTSLQSQHSNFGWKIFSINFRGFSKNELKTDFSCEPDDGSSETCFSPVNPRWRQVRYVASVFKCSKFSYSFSYFAKITFLYPPPPFEIYAYVRTYVQVKTDFWADINTTPYPQLNF